MRFQLKEYFLIKIAKDKLGNYLLKQFYGRGLTYSSICKKNKILIPNQSQQTLIEWYHHVKCHQGKTRTELIIDQHFYWQIPCNKVQNI